MNILGLVRGVCALATVMAAIACTESTSLERDCLSGETAPCESACGLGVMVCAEGGLWAACEPEGAIDCLPGEGGSCDLGEGEFPGRWSCTADCHAGPCEAACEPGDEIDCDGECGRGFRRCGDQGGWGECTEYVQPSCRPGEVESCEDGRLRRCTADCDVGECVDHLPCEVGEMASCGAGCGVRRCLGEGRWSFCDSECVPGTLESCEGSDSYCGPSVRFCTEFCGWSDCIEQSGLPSDIPRDW